MLQVALARRPPLEGAHVQALLQQADANVDWLRKSLKFANLLFTLLKGYAAEVSLHLLPARRVVEKLETFMKKNCLQIIDRLESG